MSETEKEAATTKKAEKRKSRGGGGDQPSTDASKNRKPFRTKAQKKIAQETARKCEDGAFRSSAPKSYH